MGAYTEIFEYLVTQLGQEPITPPKITQETIKLGVRHSSDMVCFPFKCTLGNLIQGLEAGADSIMAIGTRENKKPAPCRFSYYYHVQEQILRNLGYEFDIFYLRAPAWKALKVLKQMNPKLSYISIPKIIKNTYKKIIEIEKKEFTFEKKDINIGLVGEFYTLVEYNINYDIIRKLKNMDVGVDLSINLSWYLKHQLHIANTKKHLHKEVKKYFPKRIGGHAYESLYNTIDYAHKGFDGVIHLLPLSCMPETLMEMVMNFVSKDYDIPIYRFPIDENMFEIGFNTRLETFIKLLRRNKKC